MNKALGLTEKELMEVREKKLKKIREKGIEPYPSESNKQFSASFLKENEKELIDSKKNVTTAGRILAQRGHGKLSFIDIADQSGKIQIVFKADILKDDFDLLDLLDIGDFIEVMGCVFKTNAGEISIEAHGVKILAKSLKPLPDIFPYQIHIFQHAG